MCMQWPQVPRRLPLPCCHRLPWPNLPFRLLHLRISALVAGASRCPLIFARAGPCGVAIPAKDGEMVTLRSATGNTSAATPGLRFGRALSSNPRTTLASFTIGASVAESSNLTPSRAPVSPLGAASIAGALTGATPRNVTVSAVCDGLRSPSRPQPDPLDSAASAFPLPSPPSLPSLDLQ